MPQGGTPHPYGPWQWVGSHGWQGVVAWLRVWSPPPLAAGKGRCVEHLSHNHQEHNVDSVGGPAGTPCRDAWIGGTADTPRVWKKRAKCRPRNNAGQRGCWVRLKLSRRKQWRSVDRHAKWLQPQPPVSQRGQRGWHSRNDMQEGMEMSDSRHTKCVEGACGEDVSCSNTKHGSHGRRPHS